MSDDITLADIERQIALHKQAIKDLCEVGIRLDEAARMPGGSALKWLLEQGYRTDTDARKLIVQVINERRSVRNELAAVESAPYPTGGEVR